MNPNFFQSRIVENLHVIIWLLKDMFWMMEFKILGCMMIFPAIIASIWILKISQSKEEKLVNTSVLFWILANSNWMFTEFYFPEYKFLSLIFFIGGLITMSIYLYILKKSNG